VPFEKKKIAKVVIRGPKGINMIAVNRDLIDIFSDALKPLASSISAAVPVTLFKVSGDGQTISQTDAAVILNSKAIIDSGNLIQKEKPVVVPGADAVKPKEDVTGADVSPDEEKPKIWRSQKVLLAVGILLIGSALVIVLLAIGVIKNPSAKPAVKSNVPAPGTKIGVPSKRSSAPSVVKESTKEATREASQSAKLIP